MSILNTPTYRTSKSCRVGHLHSHVTPSTVCYPTVDRFPLKISVPDCFTKHQIDRPIHVEQLVKCRMQDNLEFLQWTKRYWDQYYPGGEYDAPARRKASGAPPSTNSRAGATSANARRGTTPTIGAKSRVGGGGGGGANTVALTREIETQKDAITGLEKERDFYFAKLRDIELLLQQAVEADPELEKEDDSLIKHIQAILYSTEVCLPS